MIDNLIDNSIRYSPAGSSVTVRCFYDNAVGVFAVEDSGPGIADAARELVFNRFYRLDHTTPGSGQGLAIVRDIALAHGANIVLGSGIGGQGTVFSVRFC